MSRRKFIVSLSFAPDKFGVGDELTKNVARNNVFLNVYAVLGAEWLVESGQFAGREEFEGGGSEEEEEEEKEEDVERLLKVAVTEETRQIKRKSCVHLSFRIAKG